MSEGSSPKRVLRGVRGWFTLACFLWLVGAVGLLLWDFSSSSLQLHWIMVVYLFLTVLISPVCFITYWIDKRRAGSNAWRISERTLHGMSLFGGWPGAELAQTLFRHKTQKLSFRVIYWLTVVVHLALIFYIVFFLKSAEAT